MLDAEMLLLVDDEKAQIAELHALGEERMRADDDVDIALGETLLDRVDLLAADEARGLRDAQGIALEALQ